MDGTGPSVEALGCQGFPGSLLGCSLCSLSPVPESNNRGTAKKGLAHTLEMELCASHREVGQGVVEHTGLEQTQGKALGICEGQARSLAWLSLPKQTLRASL
jgi:hypothetical protein